MATHEFALLPKFDEEKRVVKISQAETIIGRGKQFEVSDKRVSRNHAVLLLNDDGLTLKSTHINPCFVNLKSRNKKILLKHGESILLKEEDEFSLLQDKYQFSVQILPKGNHVTGKMIQQKNGSDEDDKMSKDLLKVEIEKDDTIACGVSDERELIKKVSANNNKKLIKVFPQKKKSVATDSKSTSETPLKRRKLPQWMLKNKSVENGSTSCENNHEIPASNKANISDETSTIEIPNKTENLITASTIDGKVDNNNIHTELEDDGVKDDQCETSYDNNDQNISDDKDQQSPVVNDSASCVNPKTNIETATDSLPKRSTDVKKDNSSTGATDSLNNTSTDNGSSKASKIREPCVFGKSCYRKNPSHFNEFSHPGDGDYVSHSSSDDDDDDDDRPECEYGLQCYRKNPTHKRAFKHTRRVAPKRVAAKTKQDDDDDDSYDDSFINDEEEEDDIVSDDSDWNPDQNKKRKVNNSDSEQGSDEDIGGLVNSAKEFVKNKNLWKK